MHQLEVVVPYQTGNDLVDLQQRQVAANADMAPTAELFSSALISIPKQRKGGYTPGTYTDP